MQPFKRTSDYTGKVTWYTRFINKKTGKEIRQPLHGCPNKAMAVMAQAKMEQEIFEGKFLNAKHRESIAFKDFLNLYYIPDHARKLAAYETVDKYDLKRFIEFFGEILMQDFKRSHFKEYKKKRLETVGNWAINREVRMLKNIFNKAYYWNEERSEDNERMWNLSEFNPLKRIENEPVKNREFYFSLEQFRKLLEVSDLPLRKYLLSILFSGFRKAENINIQEEHAFFDTHILRLPENKSGKPQAIPMNDLLEILLKNEFAAGNKQPFNYDAKKALSAAIENSELVIPKGCRFHSIRHTFATYLSELGIDAEKIGRLIRHSNGSKESITWIYIHSVASSYRWVTQKLAQFLVDNLLDPSEIGKSWAPRKEIPKTLAKTVELDFSSQVVTNPVTNENTHEINGAANVS